MKGLCYFYFHCILVVIIDHIFFFFFFANVSVTWSSFPFFHIKMKVVAKAKSALSVGHI